MTLAFFPQAGKIGQQREGRMDEMRELLRRARAGEPAAIEALYRQVEPRLRAIALSRLQRQGVRGQVTTGGLIDAFFLDTIGREFAVEDREHFFRIAYRRIHFILIDLLRSARYGRERPERAGNVDALEGVADPRPDEAEIALETQEELARALDALEQELSPVHRDLIERRYLGEQTFQEIATQIGLPPATASRHLQVALSFLHNYLSPRFPAFASRLRQSLSDSSSDSVE
jgi:RNA polymerase sigma factor (sigma-70 family)